MQGIPLNERKRLGALLDDRPQAEVMAMIPSFPRRRLITLSRRPHRSRRPWAS